MIIGTWGWGVFLVVLANGKMKQYTDVTNRVCCLPAWEGHNPNVMSTVQETYTPPITLALLTPTPVVSPPLLID